MPQNRGLQLGEEQAPLISLPDSRRPETAYASYSLHLPNAGRRYLQILARQILHKFLNQRPKLLEFILAKIEANNADADDALMLDTRGFVAETNATNIFIVRAGKVETSHIIACPAGITRATVIEICAAERIRCIETDLSPVDVYGADEIFCTGTMGELAGVIKIDNRIIGDGKVGPMTKRLSELYAQRTVSEGVEVS